MALEPIWSLIAADKAATSFDRVAVSAAPKSVSSRGPRRWVRSLFRAVRGRRA